MNDVLVRLKDLWEDNQHSKNVRIPTSLLKEVIDELERPITETAEELTSDLEYDKPMICGLD